MKTIALCLLFCAALATSAVYWSGWAIRKRLARYYSRHCTGRAWRKRFPSATKEEIRSFLRLFAEAFQLETKRALSFSPDDKVMEVYRAIYPSPIMADALETERLVTGCAARYSVDVAKNCGADPTLGELFDAIRNKAWRA